MVWTVVIHPDAEAELSRLPAREREAIATALEELRAVGPSLGYPHTSEVRAVHNLRELRPRRGHSAWRGFYRRVDQSLVVGAVGPEAGADPKGFEQAVRAALHRLDAVAGPAAQASHHQGGAHLGKPAGRVRGATSAAARRAAR